MTSRFEIGPYRLLRKLAVGGMAEVWEAEHQDRAGERVALKTLAQDGSTTGAVRKLWEEAQLVSALEHSNIVRTLDIGVDGSRAYFVMELLKGRTLAELGSNEEPLPLGLVLGLSFQLLAGLGHAHAASRGSHGLVHRDIKPSNLFVTNEGIAKVIDFGIAILPGVDRTKTRTGFLRGSLPYCCPEQVRNEPLDARADLFSFGLVIYELLTGQRLFAQTTEAAILSAILWSPMPPIRRARADLPQALEAVLEKLLEKEPAKRPATAAEVSEALSLAAGGEPPWTEAEIARYLALHPVRLRNPQTTSSDANAAPPEQLLPRMSPLEARPSSGPWRSALRTLPAVVGVVGLTVAGWALHRSERNAPRDPLPISTTTPDHRRNEQALGAALPGASSPVPLAPSPPVPQVATAVPSSAPPPPQHPSKRRPAGPRGPPGWLTVGMRNGWADVRIDGKQVGPTPLFHLSLPPGRHVVEAHRPDGVALPVQHVVIEPDRERKVVLR